MQERIDAALNRIEAEENVRILYAVESGSRAWGFPSADSDYDVRFLYLRRPDFYLSIDFETRSDVIECPMVDELDIRGWDLRKALNLFRKSNPGLLEWLNSPIVYRDDKVTANAFRALLPVMFSPSRSAYHYVHMARNNWCEHAKSETLSPKKYIYALRPLLAVKWIEAGRGKPPTYAAEMLDLIDDLSVRSAFEVLVERKKSGAELEKGPRIPRLHGYIEAEIERLKDVKFEFAETAKDIEALNELFRDALERAWNGIAL